jgi:hypothetical protein
MMHRSLDFHYNRFCDSYVVGREKDFLGKSVTYTTAAVMYRDLPLMPSRDFLRLDEELVLYSSQIQLPSNLVLSLVSLCIYKCENRSISAQERR